MCCFHMGIARNFQAERGGVKASQDGLENFISMFARLTEGEGGSLKLCVQFIFRNNTFQ